MVEADPLAHPTEVPGDRVGLPRPEPSAASVKTYGSSTSSTPAGRSLLDHLRPGRAQLTERSARRQPACAPAGSSSGSRASGWPAGWKTLHTRITPRSKSMSRQRRRRAQLGPPHAGGGGDEDGSAPYSGRLTRSAARSAHAPLGGRDDRRRCSGSTVGRPIARGCESRQPHWHAWVNIDEGSHGSGRRCGPKTAPLVGPVQVGERLGRHLGAPAWCRASAWMLRRYTSRSRERCSVTGPCARARRSNRRTGHRSWPVPVWRPLRPHQQLGPWPSSLRGGCRGRHGWPAGVCRLPGPAGFDDELPHAGGRSLIPGAVRSVAMAQA